MTTTELEVLSVDERQLLWALREIAPSPLRDALAALLAELVDFVREPGCAEMQADGVPCPSAQAACEECRRLAAVIEDMRARLRSA